MKFLSITRLSLAVLTVCCTVLLYSCQKDSSSTETAIPVTEEEAQVYADESTQADASFDDLEDVGRVAAEEEGEVSERNGTSFPFVQLRLRLGPCATITVTPNDHTYPKTIRIDFGNGCICADGKFRSGAIVIHLTAPIRRPGAVATITLDNFHLNLAHIQGTKIISNLSSNSDIKFTVQVVGGKVTWPGGRGYAYNSLRYVKQIQGGATNNILDDVYSIEGRANTTFNNGLSITLDTETPLIKKVACPWISNGILKIRINSRVLLLNYGAPNNGECDNKAMLSWNNGSGQRLITLP